jgi:hypothetical protein
LLLVIVEDELGDVHDGLRRYHVRPTNVYIRTPRAKSAGRPNSRLAGRGTLR